MAKHLLLSFPMILTMFLIAARSPLRAQEDQCSSASSTFAETRAAAIEQEEAGRATKAVQLFEKAQTLCPQDSTNIRDLLQAEITVGEYDKAEPLARLLLFRQDTSELHFLLGTIAAAEKKTRDAAAQFQIAAEMNPSEENVFALGTSLMRLNIPAATTVLQYGLKNYPVSVKMHVALALALYAQDRDEEGALLLCKASDLDPSDVHPMEVLADTSIVPPSVRAQVERHLADLRRSHPADGLILFDEAMVRSGRWSGEHRSRSEGLIDQIKSALKLDPHLSKAFFELGALYDDEKDFRDEIAALKSAIDLDDKVEKYHYRLAFAYRQAGDMADYRRELALYESLHSEAMTRFAQ